MKKEPLQREDIISVIEGKGAAERVPNLVQLWVHPNSFGDDEQKVWDILAKYPLDVQRFRFSMPDIFTGKEDDPEYRWVNFSNPHEGQNLGIDEIVAVDDWASLDAILANFPNPEYAGLLNENPEPDGRFMLTAGNGVNEDCPLESLNALLDEIVSYGSAKK